MPSTAISPAPGQWDVSKGKRPDKTDQEMRHESDRYWLFTAYGWQDDEEIGGMDKDAWFGHNICFFLLDPRQDTLRLVLIPDLELRSAVRRLTNTCTEASITRGWCLWLFPHKVLKDAMERKLNKFCCSRSQEPIVCVQKELCILAVHFRVFNVCALRSSLFTGTASLACHLCVDNFHISS